VIYQLQFYFTSKIAQLKTHKVIIYQRSKAVWTWMLDPLHNLDQWREEWTKAEGLNMHGHQPERQSSPSGLFLNSQNVVVGVVHLEVSTRLTEGGFWGLDYNTETFSFSFPHFLGLGKTDALLGFADWWLSLCCSVTWHGLDRGLKFFP
jgi:hypothetical protein